MAKATDKGRIAELELEIRIAERAVKKHLSKVDTSTEGIKKYNDLVTKEYSLRIKLELLKATGSEWGEMIEVPARILVDENE